MKTKAKTRVKNKITDNCPGCDAYGTHYYHHVFNGAYKTKSEEYGAVEYYCYNCHVLAADSIHNNAELRISLKKKHQERIMKEYDMSVDDFIREFGRNYLD